MGFGARTTVRLLGVVVAIVLVASACGAETDDADTSDLDALPPAAGALADPNLSPVVTELADGFGQLGIAQQRAIEGAAQGNSVCDHVAGDRATVAVSQIEVEIVTLEDDCLVFSYDVAGFRSLIGDLERFRSRAGVLAVSPLLLEYRLDQTDRRSPLDSSWQVPAIAANEALSATAPTGAGVVIAVIDSGIDTTDEAFDGITVQRVPGSGSGDYAATGHGTIAARIITAPIGGASRALAPAATLLDVPADLCDAATCGCDPCAPMTPAEAIRWSTDNGADIISMSFGYQPAAKPAWWQILLDADEIPSTTDTIEVALAYAAAHGVAMTAAAGNCAGGPSARCEIGDQFEIPAGHPAVIAVAGLEQNQQGVLDPAWYSTRQQYVELAAPGSVVLRATNGDQVEKIGTSFATPFVAASLAVLAGADGPLASHTDALDQARSILAETAIDLAPEGRDAASGHGQLQLDPAVRRADEVARLAAEAEGASGE